MDTVRIGQSHERDQPNSVCQTWGKPWEGIRSFQQRLSVHTYLQTHQDGRIADISGCWNSNLVSIFVAEVEKTFVLWSSSQNISIDGCTFND